jgi:hypothetical protein
MMMQQWSMCGGIGVYQQRSELSTISKLARNQANDLKVPGDNECSIGVVFLTVEIYKIILATYTKKQ